MLTDAEVAERAARAFAARAGGRAEWGEWVGVAWEGLAARAASRAARGLPPMDDRQRYLAARSAIVDELRKGAGGFGASRTRAAWLVPLSVLAGDADGADWVEPADHRAVVAVPEAPAPLRVKHRWTEAELRAVRKAARMGATAAEVAAGIGRTKAGVQMKWHLMGGPGKTGRPPDTEVRSELVRLLGRGLKLSDVARRRGVAYNTVRKTALRLVRAGQLVRVGGNTVACRYVPAGA